MCLSFREIIINAIIYDTPLSLTLPLEGGR